MFLNKCLFWISRVEWNIIYVYVNRLDSVDINVKIVGMLKL